MLYKSHTSFNHTKNAIPLNSSLKKISGVNKLSKATQNNI